jgi:hypothetical protein
MSLRKVQADETVSKVTFVRIVGLKSYVVSIIQNDQMFEHPLFEGHIWVLFSGDKGGGHMKFHVECLNSVNAGSVDNVHLYCMFEAHDSVENMWKVWTAYRDQVKAMYKKDFLVLGKPIRIYIGGDYHYLADIMGHQGSASTYPSSTDLFTLEHLRTAHVDGTPHTPEDCGHLIKKRTVSDYNLNYSENLSDDRACSMRDHGQYHNSVVDPFLFPVKDDDLSQFVPPGLHIMLGIVLLMYNELEKDCHWLDREYAEFVESKQIGKPELSEDWELQSVKLQKKNDELKNLGPVTVDLQNRISRVQAAMGNCTTTEQEMLANYSEAKRQSSKRKGKKKNYKIEHCKAEHCVITKHDWNILWITCDQCRGPSDDDGPWFHTLCEGWTMDDELVLDDGAAYACTKCEKTTVIERQSMKMDALLEMEDKLYEEWVKLGYVCDELKGKNVQEFGAKRKRA